MIERFSPRSRGHCPEVPWAAVSVSPATLLLWHRQLISGAETIRTRSRGGRRSIVAFRHWLSARAREPGLGLPTDRRRTAEPRHLCVGDLGADDSARGDNACL